MDPDFKRGMALGAWLCVSMILGVLIGRALGPELPECLDSCVGCGPGFDYSIQMIAPFVGLVSSLLIFTAGILIVKRRGGFHGKKI